MSGAPFPEIEVGLLMFAILAKPSMIPGAGPFSRERCARKLARQQVSPLSAPAARPFPYLRGLNRGFSFFARRKSGDF